MAGQSFTALLSDALTGHPHKDNILKWHKQNLRLFEGAPLTETTGVWQGSYAEYLMRLFMLRPGFHAFYVESFGKTLPPFLAASTLYFQYVEQLQRYQEKDFNPKPWEGSLEKISIFLPDGAFSYFSQEELAAKIFLKGETPEDAFFPEDTVERLNFEHTVNQLVGFVTALNQVVLTAYGNTGQRLYVR